MNERDANRLLAGSVPAPAFELDDPLEQTQRMMISEKQARAHEAAAIWVSEMCQDALRRQLI